MSIECDVCQGLGEIEEEDYRMCDNCGGSGDIEEEEDE